MAVAFPVKESEVDERAEEGDVEGPCAVGVLVRRLVFGCG